MIAVTRFHLVAGGHLTDEHYPKQERAEEEAERVNRGLREIGSTLRYSVAERTEG